MDVEEKTIKFLENHNIYPFSVNLLDYKNLCDTSGYDIFLEDRTILLTGRGLMNYYLL